MQTSGHRFDKYVLNLAAECLYCVELPTNGDLFATPPSETRLKEREAELRQWIAIDAYQAAVHVHDTAATWKAVRLFISYISIALIYILM